MIMEKQRVFFPCYGGCEFQSLADAVNYVKDMPGGLYVYICKLVFYNIRFRDCLRANGIDGVINMLINEAPAIALDTKAIDYLKDKWKDRMKEHIADYDIQCLPKNSKILIDGYGFNGLDKIHDKVEMSGHPRHSFDKWYVHKGYKHNPVGLHVGWIIESYPTFDSFDDSDGRSYNNYVFSKQPLTEEIMDLYCKQIPAHSDYCMVHEDIPESLLPILYYNGDSDCVLLASAKPKESFSGFSCLIQKLFVSLRHRLFLL